MARFATYTAAFNHFFAVKGSFQPDSSESRLHRSPARPSVAHHLEYVELISRLVEAKGPAAQSGVRKPDGMLEVESRLAWVRLAVRLAMLAAQEEGLKRARMEAVSGPGSWSPLEGAGVAAPTQVSLGWLVLVRGDCNGE